MRIGSYRFLQAYCVNDWNQSSKHWLDLISAAPDLASPVWSIDQIFTQRQILEKNHKKQVDTHYLFVEYKAAFDSPIRDRIFAAISELGISA